MRPSFEDIFLTMAVSLARRSTCRRLQVGCVIASEDHRRIYAIGYNGNARGGPNDCDRFGDEAVGSCGCIHAEANAVINCDVGRELPKVVYCTHLPCVTCAKYLINVGGVRRVVYKTDYRIRDSLAWLSTAGIVFAHHPRVEADDVLDNLTATQTRCTELLEESRKAPR